MRNLRMSDVESVKKSRLIVILIDHCIREDGKV